MRPFLLSLAILVSAGLPVLVNSNLAFGHGALHEQIVAVTRAIEADPTHANNYWHRGELHQEHGEFAAAETDFAKALELEPSLHGVHLARASLLLDAGEPDAALESVNRFLDHDPVDVNGRWTRANALAASGRIDDAIHDMDFAIQHGTTPQPDQYLDRARLLRSRGTDADVALALAGLDAGMRRLGVVAVLQLYAVELEEHRGRTEAALARLDELRSQFQRQETLLARRGEILEAAGRGQEARASYAAALSAIAALPPRLSGSTAMCDLKTRLKERMRQSLTSREATQ